MSTTDCETVPIADDELPSYAVVELIADQRDVSVTEVGPVFYESGVDPDFLDALFYGCRLMDFRLRCRLRNSGWFEGVFS